MKLLVRMETFVAKGVEASHLGQQPVGEAAQITEGVWQFKVPVPIPLRFVSVYLVKGDKGWTLIDAGFDNPDGRAAWISGAERVGLDLDRDVERIIVTHFHPDHIGAAWWLQDRSGAPVYMLGSEISNACEIWKDPAHSAKRLMDHFRRFGMDAGRAEKGALRMRTRLRLPEKVLTLSPDGEIRLGGGIARVIHAPGHADHQLALYDEEQSILFAADHVLLKITPNIGVWPESEPEPLARYLSHLSKLRGLPVDLVLPGHGPLFHDLDGRISELLVHHEERLEVMRRELQRGPRTAFEVSRTVFRDDLTLYEQCFALGETVAHLEYLVGDGRATCSGGERVLFDAA